jgi:cytochrome b6-f complex iron-sulfur subunit
MDVEEPNQSADSASAAPSEPPTVASGGPPEEAGVDRRRFLDYAWKGLALGLTVEAGWTTYDILKPQTSNAFGGVVAAGSVSDYPPGTVRYYIDGRFYVASAGGALVALYQKCPHLGCRVPFCDSSGRFECPCHGSIYNIRGEYIQGPAPRGMDRFPIKIDGDRVLVDTGKVVEGPARGVSSVSKQAKGPSCIGGTSKGSAAASSDGSGSSGSSPRTTP